MSNGLVQILDGNTFVVSDSRGDIEASLTDPTGLFSYDTRFLLVPGTGTVYVDAKLSVIRSREVAEGFHEVITILNHDEKPVDLTVRLDAESDFADLFEVKDALKKKGTYDARVDDGQLHLMYQRGTFSRETIISTSTSAKLDQRGLTFKVHIDPHGEWTTTVDVATGLMGPGGEFRVQVKDKQARKRARQSMQQNLDKWLAEAPRVECDWEPLQSTYRRS